jgi:S-adenosylmethionine decarboxylase
MPNTPYINVNNQIHQEHFITEFEFEGFEGPEKKLEVEFRPIRSAKNHTTLRSLSADEWQEQLLDHANCKIISQTSNQYFDSFVLSESSLFVYPYKLILKTCGTTTLLHTVEPILSIAKRLDLAVDFVFYSRKNFVFPHRQPAPHTSFEDEIKHLETYFPHGSGYIVGPMSHDHWHLFVADYRKELHVKHMKPDQTFEVLMHDLDPEVMRVFFKDDNFVSSEETTVRSGIADLLPGSVIDAFQFDPCGYSMNGLLDESYWTIHITPEDHCSFVSFETNYLPSKGSAYYSNLTKKVIQTFKPGRCSVTLFADDSVPVFTTQDVDQGIQHLKTYSAFTKLDLPHHSLQSKSFYEFDGGYNLTFCNFVTKESKKRNKNSLKNLVIDAKKTILEEEDRVSDSSSDNELDHISEELADLRATVASPVDKLTRAHIACGN